MGMPTEGAPLLNPVLDLLERVNWASCASQRAKSGIVSRDEAVSFAFSFMLGISLLLQGRPCPPGVVGSLKRLAINVIESGDLLGFIDCLSEVRKQLCLTGHYDRTLFKGITSRWLKGTLTAIEHAVDVNLCVHPSRTFDDVVAFCGWLKRLPVCVRPINDAVAAYRVNESRLSSINLDDNEYVPQLREIWMEWFRKFRLLPPFLPRHGSGSTADAGRCLRDKWRSLTADSVADVCLRYPSLEKIIDFPVVRNCLRTAKVVFVPKQAGKDRTICMEPAWLQYLQQGVAGQLVRFSHSAHHPLSQIINVSNQDINRRLCGDAWLKELATIDLTDASDSVSFDLIKRLTYKLPLARYYYATRSSHVSIQGKTEPICKFAPMGSALCFITECFVFASVVELAFRLRFGSASRGHHSGVSVYGDDIICPSEIYHLVVDILTSLGFLVNESKSFSSGPYRESCGVEYLYGALINTVKHPRAHLSVMEKVVSPDRIGMVTDLANTLRASGFFLARRLLLKYYEGVEVRIRDRKVPFMKLIRFDPKGLIPMEETYVPRRWDCNLQRPVHTQLQCQTVLTRSSEDYRQFRWRLSQDALCHSSREDSPFQGEIFPLWSTKAVLCLSRFRHWDLLKDGELREVGSSRTGPLRHVILKTIG